MAIEIFKLKKTWKEEITTLIMYSGVKPHLYKNIPDSTFIEFQKRLEYAYKHKYAFLEMNNIINEFRPKIAKKVYKKYKPEVKLETKGLSSYSSEYHRIKQIEYRIRKKEKEEVLKKERKLVSIDNPSVGDQKVISSSGRVLYYKKRPRNYQRENIMSYMNRQKKKGIELTFEQAEEIWLKKKNKSK